MTLFSLALILFRRERAGAEAGILTLAAASLATLSVYLIR